MKSLENTNELILGKKISFFNFCTIFLSLTKLDLFSWPFKKIRFKICVEYITEAFFLIQKYSHRIIA